MGCADAGPERTQVRRKTRAGIHGFFLNLLILLFHVSSSSNRELLDRKACLAPLAPLATDYKELK